MRRSLLVLAAVSLLLLNSCGLFQRGSVIERDGLFVLVGPEALDEAGIGFAGTVQVVDGCVGLRQDDASWVLIWPQGTELVSSDPVALEVPHVGRVEEGAKVTGGGAEYDSEHPVSGVDVPSECQGNPVYSFTPEP